MGKKTVALFLGILVLTGLLCACGGAQQDVQIDYGDSQVYTTEEMDAAIQVIQDTFADFKGCTLYALTYAGDEVCENELGYCQSLSKGETVTSCMVFHSVFRSPKEGGGAWEADTEYTWSWYLGKLESGKWVLLTYGYA